MSKICIVGMSNIKHISLISLYTEFFDAHKIPYDIIYLDRYGIEEKTTALNQYCFQSNMECGRVGKLLRFLKFRRYAIKIIKEKKYDLVITWQATVAYLLCDFLKCRYKGRFVINIRDYIMENNPAVRWLLKRQARQAAMVTISSKGFLEFLPEAEYILVNSINKELLADVECEYSQRREPFKIGFVGNCRFFAESYQLIDALANDERFELWYCGTNSHVLENYANKNNIKNVYTTPGFPKEETINIMSRFHMINSAFGSDAWDNRTLMPIRLYTAMAMHLPVLVNGGTQVGKEVGCAKVGFVIHDYEGLADVLYAYLKSLDSKQLKINCNQYLERAQLENEKFYERLGLLIGVNQ